MFFFFVKWNREVDLIVCYTELALLLANYVYETLPHEELFMKGMEIKYWHYILHTNKSHELHCRF